MPSLGEWRIDLRRRLFDVARDFAASDADAILGEVAGANPTQLTLRYQESLAPDQESRLAAMTTDRLSGTPLGYVLGHIEFFGLDLLCDRRVLIPRPDTEEVVHIALQSLTEPKEGHHPLVIDVGTGSGNIALAIASERPDVRVIATDVSADALTVAQLNIDLHHRTERVLLVQGLSLRMFSPHVNADLIVGNPPYIADGDPEVQDSVRNFEPAVALYSGPDGTEILTELIRDARTILRPGGALVCEIGHRQAHAIHDIASGTAGWKDPTFYLNFAGVDRVFEVRKLL